MGTTAENRIFVENENHEVVWEGKDRAGARRYLRTSGIEPGTYNILGRIETDILVEPPRVVRGNRVHAGQRFRIRASKKDGVPENDVDPDIENEVA